MKAWYTVKFYFLPIVFLLVISLQLRAQENNIAFTQEEIDWIASHQTLNVANEMDWPPFDFVDDGQPAGYSIDLIELIAEKTGLNIEFVNGYSWDEILDLFKNDEIQILPAVFKDDQRISYMDFTSSYYIQPSVLVTNVNDTINSIHDLSNKNIAVIKGFSITSELKKNYPDINTVPVETIQDGLLKVSAREVDGFVESIGVVSYYMKENFIPNLKITTEVQLDKMESPPLHIAVHKNNLLLRNILQKGLESISVDEMNEIRIIGLVQAWLKKK